MAGAPTDRQETHYKEFEHKIVKLPAPVILEGATATHAIVVIEHKKLRADDSIESSKVLERQMQWGATKRNLVDQFTDEITRSTPLDVAIRTGYIDKLNAE